MSKRDNEPAASPPPGAKPPAAASGDARRVERAYLSPEITHQRFCTLKALSVQPGDAVLDAGCGPGLLAAELARQAGDAGRVLAVDKSDGMLALARERCKGMPQVELRQSTIEELAADEASFDAVACTQLLLYISDAAGVLARMRDLLKPGGRIAIVETDWRGCVLNSDDADLTEALIRAWDEVVPSPNLPARLAPMLRAAGFVAVRVEAIPIVDTSLVPGGYSSDMIRWLRRNAVDRERVDAGRARAWLDDLERKAGQGEYFFCVNRFLFSAVR